MTDRKQDIVERLRALSALDSGWYANVGKKTGEQCCAAMSEAAAEIERLRKALSHALDNASDMKAALCRDLDPDYES